jgi:hypothetical protein
MAIGAFIGDAQRNLDGTFYAVSSNEELSGCFGTNMLIAGKGVLNHNGEGVTGFASRINFWNGEMTPTALENRSASISYYPCIKY